MRKHLLCTQKELNPFVLELQKIEKVRENVRNCDNYSCVRERERVDRKIAAVRVQKAISSPSLNYFKKVNNAYT